MFSASLRAGMTIERSMITRRRARSGGEAV
jgi:hypothetical protein